MADTSTQNRRGGNAAPGKAWKTPKARSPLFPPRLVFSIILRTRRPVNHVLSIQKSAVRTI